MTTDSTPALPYMRFPDEAGRWRSPVCRNCNDQGPWIDAQDRTDTSYADWASGHAAATGHHLIADVMLTYSPGEVVNLGQASRKARRPLGRGRA